MRKATPVSTPATASPEHPIDEEKRIDPEDGCAYTLSELKTRHKGAYTELEIETYFNNDCKPVIRQAAKREPTSKVPVGTEAKHADRQKFNMSIKEWLAALDDSGFVQQYHDTIIQNFDSLEQIVDIYAPTGELNKQFFEDVGIKKLGHKRLFEKWFKDSCHN